MLTLTFWRPQGEPIPPEPGPWTDVGGLTYSTVVQHLGHPPPPASGIGLTDQLGDQPASVDNKLTLTSAGASWSSGEASIHFGTDASRPGMGAGASQTAWFRLP